MEPLLQIADELERRDAAARAASRDVEGLQHELEELRTHAAATAAFLRSYPEELAAVDADERAAAEARGVAERALREAEVEAERANGDPERLAAERRVQHARDAVVDAGHWAERARTDRMRIEQEVVARRRDAERLEARAHELAEDGRLAGAVAPPAGGLHGLLDWASRARGELILAHAALATERDRIVREASELVGSVLGEPLTAIGVDGVRERLARALGHGST